ncbi:hypothetical protein [Streptomyces sp. NBC_00582]|uniref:hypothetical protein n=1 Tax=Streptomyces sp. NBC_00582 TaxID=2975783 RepID=UPI0010643C12|nr:hypothetical protein [Streptomyces sp. NBC_00582]WUB59394.1 hypothetical protein OG852_02750 [Streptomyces sp. NBC_00582]
MSLNRRSPARLLGSAALVTAALVGSLAATTGTATAASAWFAKFGSDRELGSGIQSVRFTHLSSGIGACGNVVAGAGANDFNPQLPRIVAGDQYQVLVYRSRDCAGGASTGSAYQFSVDQDVRENGGFTCRNVIFLPGRTTDHRWINCG